METRLLQKPTSLDHFLTETANNRRVDIVFLCGGFTDDNGNIVASGKFADGGFAANASSVYGKRFIAATACAAIYGRRPGVSARTAGI
jgi:hypothetical protein